MKFKWFYLYPVLLFVYSVYSYSQVAPNLVLSSHPLFWRFQQSMWQLGFHQRAWSTGIFILFICLLFLLYGLLLKSIRNKRTSLREVLVIFGLSVGVLLASYPALSNDIFNYLMNGKIVHHYQESPYTHAAWDFPDDPWLNFMTNIHTTTPYGKVWTGLSALMYVVTFGDLQFGMLAFRLLAVAAVVVIGASVYSIRQSERVWSLAFFILNPLVLLEAVNNAHNDIVMMAFFMGGVALFYRWRDGGWWRWLPLIVGWMLSVYTKLVTVVAPPVYLGYYVIRKRLPWFNWADILSLVLVFAMFADSSHRFFPWYFLWPLSIAAVSRSSFTKVFVGIFSFSSLLSYGYYLFMGTYSAQLEVMRLTTVFIPPVIYLIAKLGRAWRLRSKATAL